MTLLETQWAFSESLAHFLEWLSFKGYKVSIGEVWRSPDTCELYAKEGKGIRSSLHDLRLAVDLNLYRDGKWLTHKEEYAPAGEYWKSLSYELCDHHWGGDFASPDSDHFSIGWNNVK